MKRQGSFTNPRVITLALLVCLAIPAAAYDVTRENVELQMTFDRGNDGMFSDTGTPFFDNPYNATGNVTITQIDLTTGTARLVGFNVDFDVDVCRDFNCLKIIRTLHYKARFDDTAGQAFLTNPQDPNSLEVTGNPTGIWIHRNGGGKPDTVLQFAGFIYNQTPPLTYTLNFAFFSREFNANITVNLTGPPSPAPKK